MYTIRFDFCIDADSGKIEYAMEDEVAEKLMENAPKEWIAKQFVMNEVQPTVWNVEIYKKGTGNAA